MKKIEDNASKYKNISCSWVLRINNVKMSSDPEQSIDLMQPVPNNHGIFHTTTANNPKICIEPQKATNSQSNFEKKRTKLKVSQSLTSKYASKVL